MKKRKQQPVKRGFGFGGFVPKYNSNPFFSGHAKVRMRGDGRTQEGAMLDLERKNAGVTLKFITPKAGKRMHSDRGERTEVKLIHPVGAREPKVLARSKSFGYSCPTCGQEFETSAARGSHQRVYHKGDGRIAFEHPSIFKKNIPMINKSYLMKNMGGEHVVKTHMKGDGYVQMIAKKCSCGRTIRHFNKTGLCNSCYEKQRRIKTPVSIRIPGDGALEHNWSRMIAFKTKRQGDSIEDSMMANKFMRFGPEEEEIKVKREWEDLAALEHDRAEHKKGDGDIDIIYFTPKKKKKRKTPETPAELYSGTEGEGYRESWNESNGGDGRYSKKKL